MRVLIIEDNAIERQAMEKLFAMLSSDSRRLI